MTPTATPLRHLLIPGRHHLLTTFQARRLTELLRGARGAQPVLAPDATVIWAVTSANHQMTRRNPFSLNRREVMIELLCGDLGVRCLVVPVVDVPATPRYAEVVLKSVTAATGERLELTPADTLVATSTPAMIAMFSDLGFAIEPLELDHPDRPERAWEVLIGLCSGEREDQWRQRTAAASLDVIDRYGLDEQLRIIFADPILGSEGDLTATRNYRTYMDSFDQAAQRKWDQARPHVHPGRIVDIGCGTGAVLELAAREPLLAESDLFGIEVARPLYEECVHRRDLGAFANPNTFFFQRNVLSGPVFPAATIQTSTTFALTHEILSYGGGMEALQRFVGAIHAQTSSGGVWINSDVCGPADPDEEVILAFHQPGLDHSPLDLTTLPAAEVEGVLAAMTPAQRFIQFAQDFRRNAGVAFPYWALDLNRVRLTRRNAMEFMSKYAYLENWLSETHEQFCALDWTAWTALLERTGFRVDSRSGAWRNDWMVANRFDPVATLSDTAGAVVEWPETHLFCVAVRP